MAMFNNQRVHTYIYIYAIYGNSYHQCTSNVSIYASTMDPMDYKKHQITIYSGDSHDVGRRPGFTENRDGDERQMASHGAFMTVLGGTGQGLNRYSLTG